MKVGDKVRLIHGKEEGIIVKIVDPKTVEVEIEDGFRIPIMKTDLVIIASEENIIVAGDDESVSTDSFIKWNGVYLAFLQFNDQLYALNLINDTGYKIYFTIGEEENNQYKGIFSGIVEKTSFVKLTEVSIKDFENWPEFVIQLLFFQYGQSEYKQPIVKKVKFRSASFFKSKKLAPVLNKETYLFRLDQDALKINSKELEETMSETKKHEHVPLIKPSKEIDLHIEKLTDKHSAMSNSAMLSLQMNEFQKNLDNAIASGMEEIIFIHGVGNGVLKKEIHKVLSSSKSIKFFQEAQKEKFGYGATLVRLK